MELENKLKIENFDKEVLREYDIRGVVGVNINQNTLLEQMVSMVSLVSILWTEYHESISLRQQVIICQ